MISEMEIQKLNNIMGTVFLILIRKVPAPKTSSSGCPTASWDRSAQYGE